jgi:membrane-bound serine protease (ClpP class)
MIGMVRLAVASRSAKVVTGNAGMLGLVGKAETAVARQGMVFVRGELWKARSETEIARGEPVRVTGIEGLTLVVEPGLDSPAKPESGGKWAGDSLQ